MGVSSVLRITAVVVLAGAPLGRSTVRAQVVPTGFSLELVVAPPFLQQVFGFAFLPDSRILIIEGDGNIRLAAVGATNSAVIATVPNVATDSEDGLLGIAVDPDWPTRPYVYVYYTHTYGPAPADSTNRVSMLTASGDLADPESTFMTLGSQYDVLHIPNREPAHNGGTLRFGTDGMLYVSSGEDFSPCDSQDLTSLKGKLLRLDVSAMPGPGTGPPPKADVTPIDNPFAGPGENARLVYNWGLRNPFRFTFDSLTGDLFIGDVGSNVEEEVDLVEFGSGGGQNFGWPRREGFGVPMNQFNCGAGNPFTEPIYAYSHVPFSSIIAGPRYRLVAESDVAFPESYDGSYFFLEFGQGWIRRIVDTGPGWELAAPVPGQPSAENWAEGLCLMVDFQEGPDGALYMACMGCAMSRGIWRIVRSIPTEVEVAAERSALRVEARPNPATSGNAWIQWEMPRAARGTLTLHDVSGRRVRRLAAGNLEAQGRVRWDGADDQGRLVPAGAYLCRLETEGGGGAKCQMTLLR